MRLQKVNGLNAAKNSTAFPASMIDKIDIQTKLAAYFMPLLQYYLNTEACSVLR